MTISISKLIHNLLLCCFLFSFFSLLGQNSSKSNKKRDSKTLFIKVYLASNLSRTKSLVQPDSISLSNFSHNVAVVPNVSFRITKQNKRFFQFNIENLSYDKLDNLRITYLRTLGLTFESVGAITQNYNLTTSYEWGSAIFNRDESKHHFYISGTLRQFNNMKNTVPYTTINFPDRLVNINATLGVTPRWEYQINEKFTFDFNASLYLVDLEYQYRNFQSPMLPRFQQRTHTVSHDWLPTFLQFRVGISCRI